MTADMARAGWRLQRVGLDIHKCSTQRRGAQGAGVGGHGVGAVDDADAGQPEVGELDVPRRAHQQVVRLQVPVDDALQQDGVL
jgi:hypothetical protein